MKDIAVLIPAYNPDGKLPPLVERLRDRFDHVLVVDDGSTEGREVFPAIAPRVDRILVHERNRGKGAAIKTGLSHIMEAYPDVAGVVTADADGQHRIEDIVAVAEALRGRRNGLVLGVRSFSGKDVPFRSWFGNTWTKFFFFILTGLRIADTQTGLRGIPRGLFRRLLALEGDRYEYEMVMLADARHHEERPMQIPIATVYLDKNATSHFNPVRDSIRIYGALLRQLSFWKFCASSVLSFLLDNAVFALCLFLLRPHMAGHGFGRSMAVLASLAAARIVSSNFNYAFNRKVVFDSDASRLCSYFQYWGLVLLIAASSYFGVMAIVNVFDIVAEMGITAVKIAVETALFVVSYQLQKRWIFRAGKRGDVI